MEPSLHIFIQVLRIFAAVAAIGSFVGTAVYVRDHRQRMSGLLLSGGLIILIAAPMFPNLAVQIAFTIIAVVMVIVSAVFSIRTLRASSN